MTFAERAAPAPPSPAPQRGIALFYATLFMSQGVTNVFAGIWFHAQGITETQIGLINAAPVAVLLLANLWIGRLADRADDWRRVIVWGAGLSGVTALLLAGVTGFWPILIVWTLTHATYAGITPVVDAAAMRLSRRAGFDFSAVRAWATVGYLVLLFLTGWILGAFGAWLFLWLFCGTALLRAAAAQLLPRFRTPSPDGPVRRPRAFLSTMRPWFVLPLVGWAVVFSTHRILDAFQALLLAEQGLSPQVIGALIALGAASEAAMFFLFRHVGPRVAARWLILASALVSGFRWAAFSFSPDAMLLVPLQLLHGITYAMGFMACVTFIANWTDEDNAAEAQSFFTVLQQGFSVLALVGFGPLFLLWGPRAYLVSAAIALSGGLLIWLSMRLKQPQG